ncbi:MAG: Phosphate regulon transcriptional regulatory protein PhoB [Spirochaetes bacterium ADurb.Bin218]|jgi:DNA-binding response OmpR family regulator|nr:response regulator transcription factor [Spirochaetota bacterium]OQA98248.1 MAG: Phosphate regulon transcriptional regulatory protein PhoB [Spirochaetes bacterium ADurb.Bin218]HOQ10955.1 response regulator transcription factor [Spirochaetota bacterium]HPD77037.1 response regulator transcription factor [Spirochaetota bacterium]HRU64739.1 response regulator transcription factor [Spirochaetota bacterium]
MKKKIFVVDDEKDIREILKINLSQEGYEIFTYASAKDAGKGLETISPDLIILDIMMEGKDGYDFCREIRVNEKFKNIPIIFLSARSEEFDKVLGLELGADDFITKPFSIKELKSRVKAVLRRTSEPIRSSQEKILRYKGVELNLNQYSLVVDGVEIKLTKTEFNILALFMENPGKIFSRDNIIDSVRGHDVFVVDRTIDVHIMNLRKKLGQYKNIITTFSGVGYGFKE